MFDVSGSDASRCRLGGGVWSKMEQQVTYGTLKAEGDTRVRLLITGDGMIRSGETR